MNDEIHPQEIVGTGLAPSDFEIIAGKCSLRIARVRGYHPDDEWREELHKMPKEQ